jgi:hypothetical protein
MAGKPKEDENDDYGTVAAMADRLGLKGKERNKYIHDHMTGFGYRMVPSYVKDDDDDQEGNSRFFSGSRGRSSSRSRRGRDRDDEDDDYAF